MKKRFVNKWKLFREEIKVEKSLKRHLRVFWRRVKAPEKKRKKIISMRIFPDKRKRKKEVKREKKLRKIIFYCSTY